jgi:hypothetical protein
MTARTPSSSACEGACSISSASRDSRDGKPPVPSIRLQSVSSVSRFAGATSEELPAIQWVAPRYSFARGAVSFGLPAALTTLLLGADVYAPWSASPSSFLYKRSRVPARDSIKKGRCSARFRNFEERMSWECRTSSLRTWIS